VCVATLLSCLRLNPLDPLSGKVLEIKQEGSKVLYVGDVKVSEEDISGHIGSIIRDCCAKKENRPGFESIVKKNFSQKNPFHLEEKKGEFFSCGFLTNTNIFVADSVVVEVCITIYTEHKELFHRF